MSGITIPKSVLQDLVRDVRRGIEVCAQVARVRRLLRSLPVADEEVERAAKACEDVGRLRVELAALERRLIETDDDITPLRPPSSQDIRAAFDASVDFAQGKRKPPSGG